MRPTTFINHGGEPCFFNMRGLGAIAMPSIPPPPSMRGCARQYRDAVDPAATLDAWLREAMANGDTREQPRIGWEWAPGARQAQPHEDHLLPLMMAAGAASGEPGQTVFRGRALGKPISGFRFG